MIFSIIVPVYRVEEYLRECVDSILMQTYQDYEVLLIDDGSPDQCPQICEEYKEKDSRVQAIHKKNGGLSSARNTGLDAARGSYIMFLDADDILRPNALSMLADALEERPDVLVSELYNTQNVHVKDLPVSLFTPPSGADKKTVVSFVFSSKAHTWPAPQYIVSRELIQKYALRFEEGYYHEDVSWTSALFARARSFAYFDQVWYIRRIGREGSITNVVKPKRTTDTIRLVAARMKSDVFENEDEENKRIIFNQLSRAAFSSLIHYMEYDGESRKEICRLIHENMFIFSYATLPHQKGFTALMRLIGADGALKLYCKLFRR